MKSSFEQNIQEELLHEAQNNKVRHLHGEAEHAGRDPAVKRLQRRLVRSRRRGRQLDLPVVVQPP